MKRVKAMTLTASFMMKKYTLSKGGLVVQDALVATTPTWDISHT